MASIKLFRKTTIVMIYFQMFVQVYCICNLVKTLWFPADDKAVLDKNTFISHIILTVIKTIGVLFLVSTIVSMRNEKYFTIALQVLQIFIGVDLLFQFFRLFRWSIDVDKELHDVYNFPMNSIKSSGNVPGKINPERHASSAATVMSVWVLAIQFICGFIASAYVRLSKQHQAS